ncbi:MAG: ATP-binding cassette domain-containing protein [Chloroflexota bacterium]|nr:ATP-binding cassette domain-containing protein [Chloroflexota bacterium]
MTEPVTSPAPRPLLQATSISKHFGAVVALDDVSITVYPGEVTGLVGDNGAGKSTLIKILSGAQTADRGTLSLDGAPVHFASPSDARSAGVETVYQDLALAGNMTIWANIFLGRERLMGPRRLQVLDKRRMAREAREMLERLGLNVPPINTTVASMSGGQRQAIAIARAAAWGTKVIVLDEPTAALGVAETHAVEEVIKGLRDKGFGILMISHNLQQIDRLTDRIWVLRRGQMVDHCRRADTDMEEIVSVITGAASSFSASRAA